MFSDAIEALLAAFLYKLFTLNTEDTKLTS